MTTTGLHCRCSFFSCGMQLLGCSVRILVPWSGIKLWPPALRAWNLSHWTTREVQFNLILTLESELKDFCLLLNGFKGQGKEAESYYSHDRKKKRQMGVLGVGKVWGGRKWMKESINLVEIRENHQLPHYPQKLTKGASEGKLAFCCHLVADIRAVPHRKKFYPTIMRHLFVFNMPGKSISNSLLFYSPLPMTEHFYNREEQNLTPCWICFF